LKRKHGFFSTGSLGAAAATSPPLLLLLLPPPPLRRDPGGPRHTIEDSPVPSTTLLVEPVPFPFSFSPPPAPPTATPLDRISPVLDLGSSGQAGCGNYASENKAANGSYSLVQDYFTVVNGKLGHR